MLMENHLKGMASDCWEDRCGDCLKRGRKAIPPCSSTDGSGQEAPDNVFICQIASNGGNQNTI